MPPWEAKLWLVAITLASQTGNLSRPKGICLLFNSLLVSYELYDRHKLLTAMHEEVEFPIPYTQV
ncbi:hypothetical protein Ciccas_006942 [Cichlidogyrus casuarinus]|uniref:Uncharacterized protein n=1 Tax=Cichlidogyrus casuarinus TaxID=1844966 RepID=A0ABD2Q4A7_9PLAT